MLTSIEKCFPHSFVTEKIKLMKPIWETMIAEDAERAKKSGDTVKQPDKQQRIVAIIYNLREQTALWSPRHGPIVDYPPISPATQLRDIGYDAVPALIEGCDDNRLTRARTWAVGSPPGLLPIGFFCHEILREITGQNFKDKASARLWWQEFQNKGEKQILIDGTEAGDASSPAVAERLLKKYPDAALASIIKGAQRSKNGSVRSQLVRIAAKLKGDEAFRFLRDESRGPWFESRYTAANALLASGRDEGVLAMIQE
jgi:hypothetical protein